MRMARCSTVGAPEGSIAGKEPSDGMAVGLGGLSIARAVPSVACAQGAQAGGPILPTGLAMVILERAAQAVCQEGVQLLSEIAGRVADDGGSGIHRGNEERLRVQEYSRHALNLGVDGPHGACDIIFRAARKEASEEGDKSGCVVGVESLPHLGGSFWQ